MASQSQMKFSGKRVAKQLFQKRMTKMSLDVIVLISPDKPSVRLENRKAPELRAWSGDWGFYAVPGDFGDFYVTIFPRTRSTMKAFDKAKKLKQVGPIAVAHDLTINLTVSKIEAEYMGESDDNVLRLFKSFGSTIVFHDEDSSSDEIVRAGWRDVVPVSEVESVWASPSILPASEPSSEHLEARKVKTIKEK